MSKVCDGEWLVWSPLVGLSCLRRPMMVKPRYQRPWIRWESYECPGPVERLCLGNMYTCRGTYPQLPGRLRGSRCLMGGGSLGTCSLWQGLKSGTSQSRNTLTACTSGQRVFSPLLLARAWPRLREGTPTQVWCHCPG